jgi:tRNA (mo5U34)-methyltransferase
VTTPGESTIEYQEFKSRAIPVSLQGKTVLDVGSNNGYFSFLCEQRGAKRVLGIDDMTQSPEAYFQGFEVAKRIFNSKVEFMKLSLYDVDTLKESFDVTLFLDVYYHLEDLLGAFRKISAVTREIMVFCGLAIQDNRSIAFLAKPREIHPQDGSNCWIATPKCLEKTFERVGFSKWKQCGHIPEQGFPVPGFQTIRISYIAYK